MFITIEGIDGSGKTSVARSLAEWFRSKGTNVILTKEPTDTWLGLAVKRAIESDISPWTETFLFMADRSQHCQSIRRWLVGGNVVISDRYSDSCYAYQGARLGFEGALKWLSSTEDRFVVRPDVTFLLLLDPAIALERLERKTKAVFENAPFLQRVQENYLAIAKGEKRVVTIDAAKPLTAVLGQITSHVEGLLG